MSRPRFLQPRLTGFAVVLAACASASSGCSSPSKPTPTQVFDPPAIACPEPQTVRSLLGDPLSIVFGDPTAAKGKPPVTAACDPPSGSTFQVGETTVTCVATDSIQRSSSCTFLVTVLPPLKLSLTRFVAFGDSLTYGEDGQSLQLLPALETFRLPPTQRYPEGLQQLLKGRYTLQSPTVLNAGQPGESASNPDAVTRFSNTVTRTQFDVVLLMEGSNDVTFFSGDSFVEIAAIANLRDMLRTAKSRGVRPLLATIPPQLESGSRGVRGAKYVVEFNDRLKTLASSEGVPLVDVYAGLNSDSATYIGPDGLHPTAAGYAKMADVFLTSIEQTIEIPPQPSGNQSLRLRRR